MRIIFLGNVADYSPRYLEALVRRAERSANEVSIVAVICPAFRSRAIESTRFTAKRRIGDALDWLSERPLPKTIRSRLAGVGAGVHREMQRLAHRCNAPIWWPTSLSNDDLCDQVARLGADLTIVAGLNRIVREPALNAFPPMYNVHPSMLPAFRGAVPEYWQLDAGLTESGVTIHRIDHGVDTGPIVRQRAFDIEPWFDAPDLTTRGIEIGTEMLDQLLHESTPWQTSTASQSGGSYQPIPGAAEYAVPFDRSASGVFDRARAAGFSNPLTIHVGASEWPRSPGSLARDAADDTVMLRLFGPVPHPNATKGVPGLVTPTYSGGCVVRCAIGAVEFRRALAAPSTSRTSTA